MSSKGEAKIREILTKAKIDFIQEVSFPDLRGLKGRPLRFDFAIIKDKKIIVLIEYDGEQHYRCVSHFQKSVFDFKKTQEWDRKKNSYALSRKISLIRVPFWDYEILTLERLLNEPTYRVKNKYHIDLLKKEVK